jgi:hypothetical protein
MALSKIDSAGRTDWNTVTETMSQGRGLILNGQQVEIVAVSKLTGDTTGSIDLSMIRRPRFAYVIPTRDSAGNNVAALTPAAVTFTHTDNDTIAMTGLGNWTVGLIFVTGRQFSF